MENRIDGICPKGGIEVVKASAGSGKTYTLAKTYLSLLMKRDEGASAPDRDAFRHILAVTFTNKATAEMKSRIIRELDGLSKDGSDPDSRHAKTALSAILNDYGSFQVTTIDKFFQQVLKAFAREIGQFPDYQVDLDRDALVEEASDRVMDSFSEEDPELLDNLFSSSSKLLEEGYGTNIRREIKNFAKGFFSEIYNSKIRKSSLEGAGIDTEKAFSEENLNELQNLCSSIIREFDEKLKSAVSNAVAVLNGYTEGLSKNGSSVITKLKGISFNAKIIPDEDSLGKTIFKAAEDGRECFRGKGKGYSENDFSKVSEALSQVLECAEKGLKERNTALILRGQAYAFRIADRLRREFDAILREKHILGLEDTNHLINEIIGNDEASFIYEKLGVKYRHFLLDEFQDTSVIQWENFLPLLRNSIAEGCYNLVVGDVKQSIYRWRNADWKILDSEVHNSLRDTVVTPLRANWRSAAAIVGFNNAFYGKLSEELSKRPGNEKIRDIYSGVEQKAEDRYNVGGSVEISFCEGKEMEESVTAAVRKAVERNFRLSDIAVLVRSNRDGAKYAAALKNEGFDVVTNDSLCIGSNAVIRRLVAQLWKLDNPEDKVRTFNAGEFREDGFRAALTLEDTVEEMLRQIKGENDEKFYEGDTAHILAFLDLVHDFESKNGNSLDGFLKFWEEKGYSRSISCAEGGNAVTVITIHKAKGLDYPYVIIPFPVKDEFMRTFDNRSWEVLDAGDSRLKSLEKAIYRVQLSSKNEFDLFAGNYEEEKLMSTIDSLNTAYVATTRASQAMHIICARNASSAPSPWQSVKSISDAFFTFADDCGTVIWGDAEKKKVETDQEQECVRPEKIILRYDSCQPSFRKGTRVKITTDDNRKRGTVLHRIMEDIISKEDLHRSVTSAVERGDLTSVQASRTEKMLSDAIEAVYDRGWFSTERAEILNERDIADAGGLVCRPDRVVIREEGVDIIDYKFGKKEDSYETQVGHYASLYRKMGYAGVRAYLWYISEESFVEEV